MSPIKDIFWAILLACIGFGAMAQVNKAPAYLLITHNPYVSIRSMNDTLLAQPTKDWTVTDSPCLVCSKRTENCSALWAMEEKSLKRTSLYVNGTSKQNHSAKDLV